VLDPPRLIVGAIASSVSVPQNVPSLDAQATFLPRT